MIETDQARIQSHNSRNNNVDDPRLTYTDKLETQNKTVRRKRPKTSSNIGLRASNQGIKKNASVPRVKKNLDRNQSANFYAMPLAEVKSDFTYHQPDEAIAQTQAFLQQSNTDYVQKDHANTANHTINKKYSTNSIRTSSTKPTSAMHYN